MIQIYHPYHKWECFQNGMWGVVENDSEAVQMALKFMRNANKWGAAMMEVVLNWKYSVEHHLSDRALNRKAWIGQAACNYKFGWPEYIIREAWWHLSLNQQERANQKAEIAIKTWESQQTYGQIRIGF